MTAPLSLFLTRFSAPPAAVIDAAPEPPESAEPLVSLTADELAARIDLARHDALTAAGARHAAEITALAATHETSMNDALTTARPEWSATEGARFAAMLDQATTELRDLVCERAVAVLRPWLAEAATARAKAELGEAFGKLLGEATSPCLRVCGPVDLVDAMREGRPDASIEWSVAETVDVTVVAGATRIETQLAAALADLVTES